VSHIVPADTPPETDGDNAPRLGVVLAYFVLGMTVGLGFAADLGGEFVAGVIILVLICVAVAMLGRLAEKNRQRVTAGEISYRAFFDHAVEGIFRTTPAGHYLAVNQALADIYGYPSPQALMSRLTDIGQQLYVEPRRREEFRQQMQSQDIVTNFVSEIYHSSGRRIWISENARAVRDWSGALICYEGTVEDVTEKFAAERALRIALRQAEIANKMKAAFLAAMSHELKTPLNAVLGFSEIIRDQLLGPAGVPAYIDYAADIHKSGARLLAIINDVLDVSRLEGGLLTINARKENLLDIVEKAILLARSVTQDEREIATDFPRDMPALHVDPQRLAQTLGNLLANALKFTPVLGKVSLTARLERDGGVTLVVADTGIGMAAETIAEALEPFRQLDGSLARKFEGAGLGLSLSKALIELHGGSLSIESKVGHGTSVTLSLPPECVIPRKALAS
jgi:PAS domain S-box-containing protein